jgi:hypothetical protein
MRVELVYLLVASAVVARLAAMAVLLTWKNYMPHLNAVFHCPVQNVECCAKCLFADSLYGLSHLSPPAAQAGRHSLTA